jgi:hypothetical protein
MVLVVIVEKSGIVKEFNLKDTNISNFYKKAGLKSAKGFEEQTCWNINKECSITLYGKCDGRAGQENKYDFPPPVDNTLFFGSCILIHRNKSKDIVDLNVPLWKVIYEKLFGGFEDIGDEDSEEDEAEEEPENKTKQGYSKDDGFVVDDEDDDAGEDDDVEEEDDDVEEEDDDVEGDDDEGDDEDDDEPVKARVQPKRAAKKSKKIENVFVATHNIEEDYINCDSELSEEEYI